MTKNLLTFLSNVTVEESRNGILNLSEGFVLPWTNNGRVCILTPKFAWKYNGSYYAKQYSNGHSRLVYLVLELEYFLKYALGNIHMMAASAR